MDDRASSDWQIHEAMMIKSTLIVLACIAFTPANAGFLDGNKLNTNCRAARLLVLGFVAGVYDANQSGQGAIFGLWLQAVTESKDGTVSKGFEKTYAESSISVGNYCAPKGIILEQVADVFCQYLANHPGDRHLSASYLLTLSLNQAWPCGK